MGVYVEVNICRGRSHQHAWFLASSSIAERNSDRAPLLPLCGPFSQVIAQIMSTHLPLTDEPVFLCFHSEEPYDCLCQWYPSVFTAPSPVSKSPTTFVCAEQYMIYHRAMLFKDTETAALIMATECPAEHQTLGRRVKGNQKALWYMNREEIVEDGNWSKIMNSRDEFWSMNKLLKMGNRELVEVQIVRM